MRAAVISDIHSNLPALEAVLAAIDDFPDAFEEIWCLGDVVGYGAQPDQCAELVRRHCDTCLIGNHDLAVLGQLDLSSFSAAAADAVRWTIENAAPETIEMLRPLSPSGLRSGVATFHASPRDPVWEYVLSIDQAAECMQLQPERISLIGHSHVALYFVGGSGEREGEEWVARGAQAPDGCAVDLAEGTWLLNPGSVGQPRDGDPRAAWLELDTDAPQAVFHRISYDVEKAAAPILESGLPKHLAERLYAGQ
jgi:predicted phosphodiesterase